MFHAFNNNMPSTERNTASINLHIKCIDYIVIKILKQIHCQIPVIFFYMILPMRVKMEIKTIHMMISSRLHSSFNRTSLFFADLKSCHIGMITWRESGIMSPISRAFWKFVPFPWRTWLTNWSNPLIKICIRLMLTMAKTFHDTTSFLRSQRFNTMQVAMISVTVNMKWCLK